MLLSATKSIKNFDSLQGIPTQDCKGIKTCEYSLSFFGSKCPFLSLFLRAREGILLFLYQLWDTYPSSCNYLFGKGIEGIRSCPFFLRAREGIRILSLANSQLWDTSPSSLDLSLPFFGSKCPFLSLFLRAREGIRILSLFLSQHFFFLKNCFCFPFFLEKNLLIKI